MYGAEYIVILYNKYVCVCIVYGAEYIVIQSI